ncbi:MAG: hypothetical protein U1C73_02950, partial [Dietzia sp.]|nr:hypothetical protein [Dietzia sp.]
MSQAASLLRVGIAYVIAIGAGLAWLLWGPGTGQLLLDGLIADLIATVVIFAFSRFYGNSTFYDAFW